jgi:hypothetical protein
LLGEDPGAIVGEISDWLGGRFLINKKTLDNFQNCSLPPFAAFWDHMQRVRPSSILPRLAIAVLSILINTATCERYFSELALIHTALCNRMDPEKAAKIAAIREHLRKRDVKRVVLESSAKRLTPTRELDKVSAFGKPERRSSTSRTASPSTAAFPPEAASGAVDTDIHEPYDEEGIESGELVDDVLAHWEGILSELNEPDQCCTDYGA